jgi:hypothetical protein
LGGGGRAPPCTLKGKLRYCNVVRYLLYLVELNRYVMNISGNESAFQTDGLTIRQEVAARAMGAIISGSFANNTVVKPNEAAKLAFDFAESFIAESNKRESSTIL